MGCGVDGCGSTNRIVRGWCRSHYNRWLKWGDPTYDALALENRLERKITRTEGCWLWTGAFNDKGYPQIQKDGKRAYAHRVMYEQRVGPIPDGFHIDHLCSTPACVRPDHLEAVTQAVNNKRMWDRGERKRQTHCKRGHPFEGENIADRKGRRTCRLCLRLNGRQRARRGTGIPVDAPPLRERTAAARARIREWTP